MNYTLYTRFFDPVKVTESVADQLASTGGSGSSVVMFTEDGEIALMVAQVVFAGDPAAVVIEAPEHTGKALRPIGRYAGQA